MIKVTRENEDAKVDIEGAFEDIMAEYAVITRALVNMAMKKIGFPEKYSRSLVREICDLGLMSDKDLKKETKEKIKREKKAEKERAKGSKLAEKREEEAREFLKMIMGMM